VKATRLPQQLHTPYPGCAAGGRDTAGRPRRRQRSPRMSAPVRRKGGSYPAVKKRPDTKFSPALVSLSASALACSIRTAPVITTTVRISGSEVLCCALLLPAARGKPRASRPQTPLKSRCMLLQYDQPAGTCTANSAKRKCGSRFTRRARHLEADGDVVLAKAAVLADEEGGAGRVVQVDRAVGRHRRVVLRGPRATPLTQAATFYLSALNMAAHREHALHGSHALGAASKCSTGNKPALVPRLGL